MSTIRLAGIVKESITDGPGIRLTVFTQGCSHHCKGCHNPETWDYNGGKDYEIEQLLALVDKNPLLKGVTLSGGEPVDRAAELLPFVKAVRQRGKDIVCYTGYIFEELLKKNDKDINELLSMVDILVDGPFVLSQRDLTLLFRGSSNQRLIDIPQSLSQNKTILLQE